MRGRDARGRGRERLVAPAGAHCRPLRDRGRILLEDKRLAATPRPSTEGTDAGAIGMGANDVQTVARPMRVGDPLASTTDPADATDSYREA